MSIRLRIINFGALCGTNSVTLPPKSGGNNCPLVHRVESPAGGSGAALALGPEARVDAPPEHHLTSRGASNVNFPGVDVHENQLDDHDRDLSSTGS